MTYDPNADVAGLGDIDSPAAERVYLVEAFFRPTIAAQSVGFIEAIAGGPTGSLPIAPSGLLPRAPYSLMLGSMDYTTSADDPDLPSQWWDGRLIQPGSITRELSLVHHGDAAGRVASGTIEVSNADGDLDTVLDNYIAISQPIGIYLGQSDYYRREFVQMAGMRISGFDITLDQVEIEVQDSVAYTDEFYPTRSYLGTGGAEGDSEMAGVMKPLIFGRVRGITPFLINRSLNIYQVHDGEIAGFFSPVRDIGLELNPGANYATYDALAAATTPAGTYDTCLNEGFFKLGSTPAGAVTCWVDGAADAGLTTRSIAEWVATEMALALGVNVNVDSFAAEIPAWVAGWLWTAPPTWREILNRFVGDAGRFWATDRDGTIYVGKLDNPAVGDIKAYYEESDIIDITRTSLPAGFETPHRERVVRYRKNWTVLTDAELSPTVSGSFHREEWRVARNVAPAGTQNAQDPPVLDLSLSSADDAGAFADRLIKLHGVRRGMFSMRVKVRAPGKDRSLAPDVPWQIDAADWSLSETGGAGGGEVRIAILRAPFDGLSQITDYQYSLDGVLWFLMDGMTATIYGIDPGSTFTAQVRAINNLGPGEASRAKSIVMSIAPLLGAPDAPSVTDWVWTEWPPAPDASVPDAPNAEAWRWAVVSEAESPTVPDAPLSATWFFENWGTDPNATEPDPPSNWTWELVSDSAPAATVPAAPSPEDWAWDGVTVAPAPSDPPDVIPDPDWLWENYDPDPDSPGAIPLNGWSALNTGTPGDGEVTITVTTAPNDNGSAITGYQYTVDGRATWVDMVAMAAVLTGQTPGADVTVQVRALNIFGPGTPSDEVTLTVAVEAEQWPFQMVVGGATTTFYGFVSGTNDGQIEPGDFLGSNIEFLSSYPSQPSIRLGFANDGQVAGATTIAWAVEGYGSVDLEWDAGTLRYHKTGTDDPFRTFMLGKVGQTVGFRLTITAPTPAVPAEITDGSWSVANFGAAGSGQVSVTVDTAPAANGSPILGYEATTDGGTTWETIGEGAEVPSSGLLTNRTPGTSLSVQVRAVNAVGTGFPSAAKALIVAEEFWVYYFQIASDGAQGYGIGPGYGSVSPTSYGEARIVQFSDRTMTLNLIGTSTPPTSPPNGASKIEIDFDGYGPVEMEWSQAEGLYRNPDLTGGLLNFLAANVDTTVRANIETTESIPDVVDPVYPALAASVVQDAASRSQIYYVRSTGGLFGGSGTNGAFFGPACLALGYEALRGSNVYDAKVLSQMRKWLQGGTEPNACGNYSAQHESYAISLICICSTIPRIWNALTASERERLLYIVLIAGTGGAFATSDLYTTEIYAPGARRPMDGSAAAYNPAYNSNHRNAKALTVAMASALFGATEFHDHLRTFTLSTELAKMDSYGFTNMRYAYNAHVGLTISEFESIIRGGAFNNARGWRCWYDNLTTADIGAFVMEEIYADCFGFPTVRGIGSGGKGINVGGVLWGTIRTTAANETQVINNLPRVFGTMGGAREFKANDSGGNDRRCSVQYVLGGARPGAAALLALIALGEWDPQSTEAQTLMDRYLVGWADLEYKVITGHRDYANGSPKRDWTGGTGGNYATFGLGYSFALAKAVARIHGRQWG